LPGLDKEIRSHRAPKFVNVEDYYLLSANTDGKENLVVVVVDNPSKPDDNLIQIKYRISELNHDESNVITNVDSSSVKPKKYYLEHNKLPRIDFTSSEQGKVQDILGIQDIAEATDIAQILLLGRAILDKIELILYYEPSQLALYSRISSIRVDDKDAIVIDPSKSSISLGNSNIVAYDPNLVTIFLEITAKYYSSIIRKLKEKSPMKDELILRFENVDGSREEHSLAIEELNYLLKKTDGGKKVARALEIYNGDANDESNNSGSGASSDNTITNSDSTTTSSS
jgi:hypothetical protein